MLIDRKVVWPLICDQNPKYGNQGTSLVIKKEENEWTIFLGFFCIIVLYIQSPLKLFLPLFGHFCLFWGWRTWISWPLVIFNRLISAFKLFIPLINSLTLISVDYSYFMSFFAFFSNLKQITLMYWNEMKHTLSALELTCKSQIVTPTSRGHIWA